MSTSSAQRARLRRLPRWCVYAAAAAILMFTADTRAANIVRIEEDWRLVVAEPDRETVSPQVTCTMAPVGNLNSHYAVFDLNLRNFPSYEAGGVQLQLWNGDAAVTSVKAQTGVVLDSAGETITWTQRMSLDDGHLKFEIVDGDSTTWGSFGSDSAITVATDTDAEDLNAYSPGLTVENSGVGFGANRVSSLVRTAIRAYSASGLEAQDTTPVVIYQSP